MTRMYRGLVLKSRDGIPRPIAPPPGVDMREEARTAWSRFYPVTVAYTAYALAVAIVAVREDGRAAGLSVAAGVVAWTLFEYLVHRHVLHGRFAVVLALPSYLAPVPTVPMFVATILQCYVIEEAIHYSVHFHRFRWRYFRYLRRQHLYHHSARGGDVAFGLTSGVWDVPFRTRVSAEDRGRLHQRSSQ